ncbi:hypothetical protein NC652_025821 [Populus alba x Populus x berolinensis]|nr:hypothetical protein NC652_025816 [Populus alba x Populus x berolinensis]KAJ6899476.1 hypothetical protein NC652_025821 [Populus alba x Populus x berolinensis]
MCIHALSGAEVPLILLWSEHNNSNRLLCCSFHLTDAGRGACLKPVHNQYRHLITSHTDPRNTNGLGNERVVVAEVKADRHKKLSVLAWILLKLHQDFSLKGCGIEW